MASPYQPLWHGTQVPQRIVLHATDGTGSGPGVASGWLSARNKDGSPQLYGSQVIINQDGTITRVVPDDQVAWSTGGNNTGTLAIEIVGKASQSRNDWMGNPRQLRAVAAQIGQWTKQYGIPFTFSTDKGISTHAMNSRLYSASEGHSDPGVSFPLSYVLHLASGGKYTPNPQSVVDVLSNPGSPLPYPSALQNQQGFTQPSTQPQSSNALLSALTYHPAHPDEFQGPYVQGSLTGGELVNQIISSAQRYGIDPKVALAVAPHEGGLTATGYGDWSGGKPGVGVPTSFGPFALHHGGALPQWVWDKGTVFANRWANSAEGIDYAMKLAAPFVKGLTGADAVVAWVGGPGRGFERPGAKWVAGEVSRSLETYRQLQPISLPSTQPVAPPSLPGGPQTLTPVPTAPPAAPPSPILQGPLYHGQLNTNLLRSPTPVLNPTQQLYHGTIQTNALNPPVPQPPKQAKDTITPLLLNALRSQLAQQQAPSPTPTPMPVISPLQIKLPNFTAHPTDMGVAHAAYQAALSKALGGP